MRKQEKTENWPELIEHINRTWKRRKRSDIGYYFQGKDFRTIKGLVRHFEVWGVMSLWDAFLENKSEWVKKTGYSVDAFSRCIPWLTDTPYKGQAETYRKKLQILPDGLDSLLNCVSNKLKEMK